MAITDGKVVFSRENETFVVKHSKLLCAGRLLSFEPNDACYLQVLRPSDWGSSFRRPADRHENRAR